MGLASSKLQTPKTKTVVPPPPAPVQASPVESITTLSSSPLVVDSIIERVIRIGRKLYGERFDEQHITSLGFGGAGVVYLIHYTENPDITGDSEQQSSKSVALKVVQLFATIEDHAAIAKHEFDIMMLCKGSDYIVKVFDSVSIDSTFAYTMEYCPLTLSKVLYAPETIPEEYKEKAEQFPLLARLTVARQISKALQYIHSLDCTHLDVKSDNVLITVQLSATDDSDIFTAKLTDFGLCVKNGEQFGLDGTTEYMAPELLQALLSKDKITQVMINSAADLYSFGIMLWEIITRSRPYRKNAKGEPHRVWTLRPKVIGDLRPDIAQLNSIFVGNPIQLNLLQVLIQRCWDKEPGKRPTASEVGVKLNEIMEALTGDELADGVMLTTKEELVPEILEIPKIQPPETEKGSTPAIENVVVGQECATRVSIARERAQTLLSTTSSLTPAFSLRVNLGELPRVNGVATVLSKQPQIKQARRRSCLIVPPILPLEPKPITSSSSLLRQDSSSNMILSVESKESQFIFRRRPSSFKLSGTTFPPSSEVELASGSLLFSNQRALVVQSSGDSSEHSQVYANASHSNVSGNKQVTPPPLPPPLPK